MGEWNPLKIDDFTWDVLKVYIKHGYGDCKLYNKAVDYEDNLWSEKDSL